MNNDVIIGKEVGGRYIILSFIGKGGMGSVYLAQDKVRNRQVAIKLIRGELCLDVKARRRFVKESQIFSYLKHPHIVEVEQFGQTPEGQLYMVMEYIESLSLMDIRDMLLPFSTIMSLMTQLLDALAHSHSRGIIHRDLKPANVLLTPMRDGSLFLKLVDFGIASLPSFMTQEEDYTRTVLGTPSYMAPEQSRSGSAHLGPSADIYSVGVILYELLSGKLPFRGEADIETIIMHLEEPIPTLVARPGLELPDGVEKIVRKAMAKKTWDRFVGAKEFSQALDKLKYVSEPFEGIDEIRRRISAHMAQQRSDEYERKSGVRTFSQDSFSGSHPIRLSSGSVELKSREIARRMGTDPGGKSASMSSLPLESRSSSENYRSDVAHRSFENQGYGSYNVDSSPSLDSFLSMEGLIYGRDLEIGWVEEACLSVLDSKPKALIIEGAWGVGKSSLVRRGVKKFVSGELMRYVSTMYGVSDGPSKSIQSMSTMLDALLESKSVDKSSLRDYFLYKFKGVNLSVDRTSDSLLSFLRDDLGDDGDHGLEASTLIDWTSAACFEMPVIICIEDIHFASYFALQYIEALINSFNTQSMRCLLICTVNSREVFPGTRVAEFMKRMNRLEGSSLKTIRLGRLNNESMLKICREHYRLDYRSASVFLDLSYGNPLLLRELTRSYIEDRLLIKASDGIYTLKRSTCWVRILPSLYQQILMGYYHRVKEYLSKSSFADVLDDVLIRLSVLGAEVEDELLDMCIKAEGRQDIVDNIDDIIESLIRLRVLQETTSQDGKPALCFESNAHPMSIMMNYSLRKLRPLHRMAAEGKLKYYQNLSLERCEQLVEHYDRMGDIEKADLMSYQAMQMASVRCEYEKVFYYGVRLFNVFEKRYMGSGHSEELEVEQLYEPINWPRTLEELSRFYNISGMRQESDNCVAKLVYCSQRYNRLDLQAIAYKAMGYAELTQESYLPSLQRLMFAFELFDPEQDSYDYAEICNYLAISHMFLGRYRESQKFLDLIFESSNRYRGNKGLHLMMGTHMLQAMLRMFMGRFDDASLSLQEARRGYIVLRQPEEIEFMNVLLGVCQILGGESHAARVAIEDYFHFFNLGRQHIYHGYVGLFLVRYLIESAQFDEALLRLRTIEEYFLDMNSRIGLGYCLSLRGLTYLFLGELRLSLQFCVEAVNIFVSTHQVDFRGLVMTFIAMMAFYSGDVVRSSRYVDVAYKLFALSGSVESVMVLNSLKATIESSRGEYQVALQLIDEVLEFASKNNFRFLLAHASVKALCYAAKANDMEKIREYYLKYPISAKVQGTTLMLFMKGELQQLLEYLKNNPVNDEVYSLIVSSIQRLIEEANELVVAKTKDFMSTYKHNLEQLDFSVVDSIFTSLVPVS